VLEDERSTRRCLVAFRGDGDGDSVVECRLCLLGEPERDLTSSFELQIERSGAILLVEAAKFWQTSCSRNPMVRTPNQVMRSCYSRACSQG
jgi:hypothetical protein